MTKPTEQEVTDAIDRAKARLDEAMHNGGYPESLVGFIAALEWATGRENSLPDVKATRPPWFEYLLGIRKSTSLDRCLEAYRQHQQSISGSLDDFVSDSLDN